MRCRRTWNWASRGPCLTTDFLPIITRERRVKPVFSWPSGTGPQGGWRPRDSRAQWRSEDACTRTHTRAISKADHEAPGNVREKNHGTCSPVEVSWHIRVLPACSQVLLFLQLSCTVHEQSWPADPKTWAGALLGRRLLCMKKPPKMMVLQFKRVM